MTVFGFGRDNVPCCPRYLTAVPQHFTIGFAEDSSFASASPVIAAATADVIVTIALPEVQPAVRQPAVSGMVTGPGAEIPTAFALGQNYPNPFNPSTTIQFAIPVGTYGRTSLRLYDLLGREIATLVDEVKEPGVYTVRWDASGFGSGVYLYRMQAGAFVAHRRLVLVK